MLIEIMKQVKRKKDIAESLFAIFMATRPKHFNYCACTSVFVIRADAIFEARIPKTEMVINTIKKFSTLIVTGYANDGVIITKSNVF